MNKTQISLKVVEQHFQYEGAEDIEQVIADYTDDIIWEAPARNILLVGKKACAEQYRKIIAGLGEIISMEFLNRYAVEDRVFDDRIFIIKLLKGNVWGAVPNKQVRMRLAHSFQIRDGLICKEIAYEMLSEL